MNITENVIFDLLPAYQSGEASEDTIQLVDTFLKSHPDLAQKIQLSLPEKTSGAFHQQLSKELEMSTLEKTRSLLRWKSWLMGFAIFFSLAPFSFTFSSTEGVHWILGNSPLLALSYAAAGVCSWLGYFAVQRKLKSVQL